MSLLFMDSFDHCGTSSPTTFGKYGAGTAVASTTNPRTGTHSLRMTSALNLTTKPFTTSGGAVVGCAFWFGGFNASDIIQVLESAIIHVAVAITAGGLLTVKRGSTVLATGSTVLVASNWYYIELKTVIDDTAGTTEVHIDGVAESALTLTGQDTRNAGTGVWDRVLIGSAGHASGVCMDDFYVCDTSGSSPRNDFLGICKVEMLLPVTDAVAAGSNAGLTPSTGTDHGALVDEAAPNTTDYNSSPTVGAKDTYNYPSMTLTGAIIGVQLVPYIAKSDATVRQVCTVVRSASTDTDGATITPTTTFQYYPNIWEQDPNAGAPTDWVSSTVNAMQAGMKVTV